ncbi:MAG: 2-amino-4-hydroxy-6-hydroxymethyldihydropteridine diphosphokinase [Alistipes sp.]|nr:2-amino-4-hydroxy-6-hydroxymethyldihydropteridine diphosphokinase [Alistipes sp.]
MTRSEGHTVAVLMFGSDAPEAESLVDRAVAAVGLFVGSVERISAAYRSAAYGFSSEREFVNRTAVIQTTLAAETLLRRINLIEELMGRDRDVERQQQLATGERYASRPIDIDIIFFGDETISTERLTVPYHYLDRREYALRPLAEVAGDYRHPALGLTPREMLAALTGEEKVYE